MSLASAQAKGNYILAAKKTIIGSQVVNEAHESLGKIEDLVIDFRNGQLAYAILTFGGVLGFGDKHFAIPWQAIRYNATDREATLKIDKERLTNAPGFDANDWPDMTRSDWADSIYQHYAAGR